MGKLNSAMHYKKNRIQIGCIPEIQGWFNTVKSIHINLPNDYVRGGKI